MTSEYALDPETVVKLRMTVVLEYDLKLKDYLPIKPLLEECPTLERQFIENGSSIDLIRESGRLKSVKVVRRRR